jgi:hypothetical protein
MINKLDPILWYDKRELSFTPLHFTLANTPVTLESRLWIYEKLRGRFSILSKQNDTAGSLNIFDWTDGVPAFEDPKEASAYELTWS